MAFDPVSYAMGKKSSGGGGGGVTILSGKSAPSSSQGSNGSVYLQYGLPDEYTSVEYLEVTDMGPYIDTGIKCVSDAYFEVTCYYTQTPSDNYGIFGAFKVSTGGQYLINNWQGMPYCKASTGLQPQADIGQSLLSKCTIKADNTGIYLNGELVQSYVDWSDTPGTNYYLFAFNYSPVTPTIYKGANERIYSCRLWSGQNIVSHFIPAVRNSDNEPGMYDLVTGAFKTNAGTGSISYGSTPSFNVYAKVNSAYAKVNVVWQGLIGTDISDINLGN